MRDLARVGLQAEPLVDESALRATIERLAALERSACSPGERAAARWIAARLQAAGVDEVALEQAPSWGAFQPQVAGLGALGVLAALLAWAQRRSGAVLCAGLAIAGILDEAQNGPRVLRRLVRRRRSTVNVVARTGEVAARRTLVVLAHHDAARTGLFYRQDLAVWLHRTFPRQLARLRTQPPQWWIGLAAPLCALAALALRRRSLALPGALIGALGTALVLDMWRSPTVAGANDDLSGVAALVALAELLRREPLRGLGVMLVSCGAEETLQDGVRAFLDAHRAELDPLHTWFLALDPVGSPHLVMLEGEGPIWMEDYSDPSFRDLIESLAGEMGIELERGLRARASSDAIIPSRAGYPTALLGSITPWRMPANYHLLSDVPDNLSYPTIADAVLLAHAVAGRLAAGEPR